MNIPSEQSEKLARLSQWQASSISTQARTVDISTVPRGSFDRSGDDYAVLPETLLPRACSRNAAYNRI